MGGFITWSGAGIDNISVFWCGVEEVGWEAGGFILEDESAACVCLILDEIGVWWDGDKVWNVFVDEEFLGSALLDFGDGGDVFVVLEGRL